MKTKKITNGGSRTRIYNINGNKTIPITVREMKKMKKMKNNSNTSKKNWFNEVFNKVYNKVFQRKKSFKKSPILVHIQPNFKTKKSTSSSSQKKKRRYLPENIIGLNIETGIIYADK